MSFAVAVSETLKDIIGKEVVKGSSPFLFVITFKLIAGTILLPVAIMGFNINVSLKFLLLATLNILLNLLSFYLYFKALSVSPLSLTVPMLSFSPVFLLMTSRLMLDEVIPLPGVIGVLMVFCGSYILNISRVKAGVFEPLKSIIYEKGSRYMLMVAFSWSITANLDKMGVNMSSPIFWTSFMSAGIGLCGYFIWLISSGFKNLIFEWISGKILLVSLLDGMGAFLQMVSITLIPVPYAISIKRTSILMSAFWGKVFYKERVNLLGVVIMFIGAVVIIVSGL